jgi:aldose 1-epimerase
MVLGLEDGDISDALLLPDNTGRFDDVVLGFKDAEDYKERRHPHFGGVVGRVANRIAKGRFKLGEQDYVLAQNDGENHLHGGNRGFDKALLMGMRDIRGN